MAHTATIYEALVLTVPEITNDEASKIETQFSQLVNEHNVKLISFERWGKYRLAYSIRKNDYGVYFLARFEAPAEKREYFLSEVKNFFTVKHNALVMRSLNTVVDPKKGLTYTKPESLEDVPRDVESFLKENKMGGLLRSRESREDSFEHGISGDHASEFDTNELEEQ
jgi:ribosomal protein S6